jgi:hypothetical protein
MSKCHIRSTSAKLSAGTKHHANLLFPPVSHSASFNREESCEVMSRIHKLTFLVFFTLGPDLLHSSTSESNCRFCI